MTVIHYIRESSPISSHFVFAVNINRICGKYEMWMMPSFSLKVSLAILLPSV